MASKSQSQRPKGRDGLLSTLDVLIQALSIAGSTCGIPPAQIAISSANALLSMIRVCSLQYYHELLAHIYPGFRIQQGGLCRPRGELR